MASIRELWSLLLIVLAVLLWSVVAPHDYVIWVMEALPVMLAIPLLTATRVRFPLTRLAYYLIAVHGIILLVGAHYTYAKVPAGNWVAELLDIQRNHYDRFAHVVQGFVPAIIAREILIRFEVVQRGAWLFFLVICFCLGFSALYEIIEWQSAVWGGDSSMEFLGTQGDIWDAQWDMLLALSGSIIAQLLLVKRHDQQLQQITVRLTSNV